MDFNDDTGTDREADVVELRVSARHEDVRLARLLASGMASQAGFAIDEIEMARLVVDEACAVLLEVCAPADAEASDDDERRHEGADGSTSSAPAGSGNNLILRCTRGSSAMRVTVSRPGAAVIADPSEMSTRVLDGLTTRWSIQLDDTPTVVVELGQGAVPSVETSEGRRA